MWPEIALAGASAGLGIVQTLWNYGQTNSEIAKARSRAKRDFGIASGQIDQQVAQGKVDIATGASSTAAGLAARGVAGDYVSLAIGGQTTDQTNRLTEWEGNRRKALATGYGDTLDALKEARAQNDLDLWSGIAGVGLSAAGLMIDAGLFKAKPWEGSQRQKTVASYKPTEWWRGF